MKEKCGLFGILTSGDDDYVDNDNYVDNDDYVDILSFVVKGLQYLQHRGEESCGIAYHDSNAYHDGSLNCITGLGLVKEVFQDYSPGQGQRQRQSQGQMQMQKHNINKCIGHVRYSTSGKSKLNVDAKKQECQPLYGTCKFGDFYLAHNGNVPGLQEHDTQYIINFIQNSVINASSWIEVLSSLVESIPAAYCLLILTKNELFAVRDRYGIRPLCIGCASPGHGHGYCFASESCALQHYNYVRDVLPGEVISVSKMGVEKMRGIQLESLYISPNSSPHICAFECIYFMNENSLCNGYVVRELRERLGAALAMKQKRTMDFDKDNTIVVGIPNSGIASAKKYAEVLGIPYVQAIKKNPNIGRTFIASNDSERKKKCKEKFVFVSSEIRGRKLVIVDDTIVRGNVMTAIVATLFEFGAVEVHIRIPAPPVVNICSLGIDIPSQEELIAFQFQKKYSDIAAKLNATSVDYLACEDLDDILQFSTYKECFLSNGNDWVDGLMV